MERYAKVVIMMILAGALHTGIARGQAAPAQGLLTDSNASTTRDQLGAIFNQYPPTVQRVLQIDPALLMNKDYLAPYPALGAFITKHPEVTHNAAYFLGAPRGLYEGNFERAPDRTTTDIAEYTTLTLVIICITGGITWIIKSLIDYRRWLRMLKNQSEIHSRLMDRLTTSEDLLAYIQSPAGKRFLDSAPVLDPGGNAGSSVGRILWSVQAGLVLALGGVGLNYASGHIRNQVAQPFFILGVLGLAVGAGFILSAVASYMIARNLGLVHGTSERPPT